MFKCVNEFITERNLFFLVYIIRVTIRMVLSVFVDYNIFIYVQRGCPEKTPSRFLNTSDQKTVTFVCDNNQIVEQRVKHMNKQIKAILFDMDGVLIDSEEYIFEAARLMFAEHGVRVKPEDALPFVGTGENSYISGIGRANGFEVEIVRDKARTYQIYGEITRGKLKSLPGTERFIAQCKEKGLKMAVASSADRVKIEINLREIGLPADTFDAIVSGEDVERKKPFPDIYLFAAAKLDVPPEECLVVEDAVSGVSAAKAAGAKCLALTTSFPADKLAAADKITISLDISLEEIM